jgi:photosystem II stability/assembly factor-like uncharacterized protein
MHQPNRIFVGTVGEGIFRSDDDGHTFTRKSSGMFVECDVRALAAHPERPELIFAGTNEGLYRTLDCGDNWDRLESPMNTVVIWSLLIDRRHPETIFAGTRPAHVFRSTDGGRSWIKLPATFERDCKGLIFNRLTTLISDPIDPDTVWVGVEIGGIQMSRDRGESWTTVNNGLSSLDIHGLAIVAGSDQSRRILATTNNDMNASDDDGGSWEPLRMAGKFDRAYFRGIFQKPGEPNVLLIGNGDGPPGSVGTIWRSSDFGRTWSEALLPGLANSTIWGFASYEGVPNRMLAYSVSGELYRSMDSGKKWDKLVREFGEIRSICVV